MSILPGIALNRSNGVTRCPAAHWRRNCYNCHGRGHTQFECPAACSLCGQEGHKRREGAAALMKGGTWGEEKNSSLCISANERAIVHAARVHVKRPNGAGLSTLGPTHWVIYAPTPCPCPCCCNTSASTLRSLSKASGWESHSRTCSGACWTHWTVRCKK